MQKAKTKSYGVIPILKNKDGFYILLVKNSKGGHWGLPKGTPEKDEESTNTAKRELFEETGIKDIDIKTEAIFEEKYNFEQDNIIYSKTNTYYPGFVNEMTESNQLDGIDEIRWVKIIDVVRKLVEWLSQ